MENSEVIKTLASTVIGKDYRTLPPDLCTYLLENPSDAMKFAQYVGDKINEFNKNYDAILGLSGIRYPDTMNVHLATLVAHYLQKPLRIWKQIMIARSIFYPRDSGTKEEKWVGISILPDHLEFMSLVRKLQETKVKMEDMFVLYGGSIGAIEDTAYRYQQTLEKMVKKMGNQPSEDMKKKLEEKAKHVFEKSLKDFKKQSKIECKNAQKEMNKIGAQLHILITPEELLSQS